MEHTRTGTRKSLAIALALTAALSVAGPISTASADTASQAQLLSLHNAARQGRGIKALKVDNKVTRYAVRHSKAMAARGVPFHTKNLARALKGRNWSIAGENVGMAFTNDGVDAAVQELQKSFMASREHRANVLRKSFDHAAVGVYVSGGKLWVTVVFYG